MRQLLLIWTAVLFLTVAHGQTNISGGIYSDTTWSQTNSPFIIIDTVIIHNVTLTIQPGVVVKFQNGGMLQTNNNGGRILASGTVTDSITFTSNSSTPVAGIYSGIFFNWSFRKSIFDYCNFQYADKAIKDGAYWDSLTVRHSVFKQNKIGMYKGSWGPELNTIDSCIFRGNTDYAMFNLYNSKISNCIIDSNQVGLKIGTQVIIENSNFNANQVGISDIIHCSIDNSQIKYNQSGLVFNNSVYGNLGITNSFFEFNQFGILDTMLGNNIMKKCYIRNNQYGLICKNDSNTTIDSCFILFNQYGILNNGNSNKVMNSRIDSNTVIGIHFDSLARNNSVINCDIKNNPIGLIDEGGLSPNLFTRNIIDNDSIGIKLENSIDIFYCNRICNNNSYALKYVGTNNINLSNNYWCTTDSISTASVIFDGNDTIGVGNVQFLPLDTMNCYLCNYNFVSINFVYPSCSTCNDGTATAISNGTPPFSYLWNTFPIQTTQTATGLSMGIYYTVCVTDSAGCTDCDSIYFLPTISVNEFYGKINISIYPNPFSAQTTLQTDNLLHNATLTVDNCFWQTVKQIKNINEQTVVLSRDNLGSGLYFVRLIQDNKVIAVEKLVIID